MDDALCLLQVKLYQRHITGLTCLTLSLNITSFTKKAANAAFFYDTGLSPGIIQFMLPVIIQRLPLALSHG